MRYIAHRALFEGPDLSRENHPDQIRLALSKGWDCEIDLWLIEGQPWLGHDAPTYKVTHDFIMGYGLWIHCKNLDALYSLAGGPLHYFWHDRDDYTLTSHNIIWTYPRQPLTEKSIWVQPEWDTDWRDQVATPVCLGICSKHVREIKTIRQD